MKKQISVAVGLATALLLFGFVPPYQAYADVNPVVTSSSTDLQASIDAPFDLSILGTGFGNTPGDIINTATNQKLNVDSAVTSPTWHDSSIIVRYLSYLVPPNILQEGSNTFVIKTSSGLQSQPFTIIGKRLGHASITSVIPSSVHDGDEIVINGSGFGTDANNGYVGTQTDYLAQFHPQTNKSIISWSDTQIHWKLDVSYLPPNFAGNTNLIVVAAPQAGYSPSGFASNLYPINIQPSTCNSWTYSDWGACSASGQQSRSILSSSPSGCTGGSPTLTQSCTPPPSCTADIWSCGNWSTCTTYGSQTRSCTKTFDCPSIDTPSPPTSQSCTPPQPTPPPTQTPPVYQPPACTADTWACDDWGACSLSGVQSRSCRITFDCPSVVTAPPVTDQYCEPPNRPVVQQIPQDSSAISNQDTIIKATVKLICLLDENRASQGSGTVIDPSGTILTNQHVVNGTLGCFVGFISNFNDEPYFGNRQIADIVKQSPSEDIAVLKLRNPRNSQLPFIDITKGNSNNFRLGTKVNIYGYPAKFGTNITYTSGDFSGTSGNYLKTTAIIEHGDSGGGAYLVDGTFIGMPSAVIKGELNALGYILSIGTINSWLSNSSNIVYNSNNNYSRVSSILENINLNKLDSLQLVIPGKSAPAASPSATKATRQSPTPSQTQSNAPSTIISYQAANQNNQNPAPSVAQPQPKASWIKRFFQWLSSLF